MIGVLSHDSALSRYTGPGTTWANEMNFVMTHAPGAGSINIVIKSTNYSILTSYNNTY